MSRKPISKKKKKNVNTLCLCQFLDVSQIDWHEISLRCKFRFYIWQSWHAGVFSDKRRKTGPKRMGAGAGDDGIKPFCTITWHYKRPRDSHFKKISFSYYQNKVLSKYYLEFANYLELSAANSGKTAPSSSSS